MKTIKKIFFVLIPRIKEKHDFGGMLVLESEKLSIEMSAETGGIYIPLSYSLS